MNTPGQIARPTAKATVQKNGAAVAMQSPQIIPFYKYFSKGGANTKITPLRGWLTRR